MPKVKPSTTCRCLRSGSPRIRRNAPRAGSFAPGQSSANIGPELIPHVPDEPAKESVADPAHVLRRRRRARGEPGVRNRDCCRSPPHNAPTQESIDRSGDGQRTPFSPRTRFAPRSRCGQRENTVGLRPMPRPTRPRPHFEIVICDSREPDRLPNPDQLAPHSDGAFHAVFQEARKTSVAMLVAPNVPSTAHFNRSPPVGGT